MSARLYLLASVCTAFLAASAAVNGTAAATTPTASTVLASEAYKALAAGDPAAAIAGYTRAIESRDLAPEVLANALLNRALAYQRLDQHDLAIADYSAALRIDAMSPRLRAMALYNRGVSYQKLDQPARAIEDFTSALFLDQRFSHAYYSRANMLRQQGQLLFALADFEKAIQFNYPDAARAYYGEALAYDGLNRPADARAALDKALAANPNYQPAIDRLAALDAGAAQQAADQITTASVGADTTPPRKEALPDAAAPPPALLSADAGAAAPPEAASSPDGAPAQKKIADRVPPTADAPTQIASATPVADQPPAQGDQAPAATNQAQADQPPPQEKIIAIEPVPDPKAAQAAASDPSPAAAPPPAAPAITGWTVQVASATTEDAAWSTWQKMKAAHRVLANRQPVVIRADLGTKGTYYRVRLTGFDNQGAARSECAKLKSGGVKCFISRSDS